MKKNKISIFEIKQYLKKKGLIISKQKKNILKEDSLGALPRTFLSSLIIISIFFIAPISNAKETAIELSKNFENNSKNNLEKLLEKKNIELDEVINPRSTRRRIARS